MNQILPVQLRITVSCLSCAVSPLNLHILCSPVDCTNHGGGDGGLLMVPSLKLGVIIANCVLVLVFRLGLYLRERDRRMDEELKLQVLSILYKQAPAHSVIV